MKTMMLSLLLLSAFGCTTARRVAEPMVHATQNVKEAHAEITDEEWNQWHTINAKVFRKAEEGAATRLGTRLYGRLAEVSESRMREIK